MMWVMIAMVGGVYVVSSMWFRGWLHRPLMLDQIQLMLSEGTSVAAFRSVLQERAFAVSIVAIFFANLSIAFVTRWWTYGAHQHAYQGTTFVFLAALLLLHSGWRMNVISAKRAANVMMSSITAYTIVLAWQSGPEGSKVYLLHYTSVPFLISICAIVTRSFLCPSINWSIFFSAQIAFENSWIAVPLEPYYCVDCLREATRYMQFTVGFAYIGLFLYAMHDQHLLDEMMERVHRRGESHRNKLYQVVSHEFKTPLNGILGCLQLIARDDPHASGLTRDLRERLNIISHCATMLNLLVENVLVSGRESTLPAPSRVETRAFFMQTVAILRNVGLGVDVQLVVDSHVPEECWFAPTAMMQVMLNLGSNAIKYGNKRPVTVEVSRPGDFLQIAVRDEGSGISEEFVRTKLFVEHERDRAHVEVAAGSGLGLAITKKLIDGMGGEIWYERNVPCGSVFHVRIPASAGTRVSPRLHPGSADRSGGERRSPRSMSDRSALKRSNSPSLSEMPVTALVAEDNAVNRSVLVSMLKRVGVSQVVCVENGLEAFEWLLSHHKNGDRKGSLVVLMDLNLPIMSGEDAAALWKETASKLRWHPGFVVAVTAGSGPSFVFDAFLPKPIKIQELTAIVAKAAMHQ